MNWPLVGGAFVTGLLGAGHCIGMCGPIVTALGLVGGRRRDPVFQVLYNVGRVATYVGLGVAAGLAGTLVADGTLRNIGRYLLPVGDLFVILVGLGSAGAFRFLNVASLEARAPTGPITRLARSLVSLPPGLRALPLGLVMGFLPCGFLSTILLTAALSTGAVTGGVILLAFGLGTAPSLLLVGGATHLLGAKGRGRLIRLAGVTVVGMGLWNLFRHGIRLGWW